MKISRHPDILHTVDLIKYCDNRFVFHTQILKCFIHRMHLLIHLRIRSIYYMQDNICISGFFQCTSKCLDQMMRKFSDKSYRICHQDFLTTWQLQISGCWIQGCE